MVTTHPSTDEGDTTALVSAERQLPPFAFNKHLLNAVNRLRTEVAGAPFVQRLAAGRSKGSKRWRGSQHATAERPPRAPSARLRRRAVKRLQRSPAMSLKPTRRWGSQAQVRRLTVRVHMKAEVARAGGWMISFAVWCTLLAEPHGTGMFWRLVQ